MGTVVHPNAESVHQLATQPSSNRRQAEPQQARYDCAGWRQLRIVSPQCPAQDEQGQHNHISYAMLQTDSLGSGTVRYGEPVEPPGNGRGQPSENAGSDHVIRPPRPLTVI